MPLNTCLHRNIAMQQIPFTWMISSVFHYLHSLPYVLTSPKSRNFALNPTEGLKIHPFKNAHTPAAMADRELDKLARYMLHIANVADFRTLQHKVCHPLLKCPATSHNCVFSGLEEHREEPAAVTDQPQSPFAIIVDKSLLNFCYTWCRTGY